MENSNCMTIHAFPQYKLTKNLLNNLSQFDVTPTAKLVLIYLSGCYNADNVDMYPRQKIMAERLGISERSVIRAVQELIKAGLILVECKFSNRYKFTSKIFCDEIMSPKKCQKGRKKVTKCHAPCNEQTNKQIHNMDVDKILLRYAESKNVRNKFAYINAIKRNGGVEEILKEYEQIEARKRYYEEQTKKVEEELQISMENCVKDVPQSYWDNVRNQILGKKKQCDNVPHCL